MKIPLKRSGDFFPYRVGPKIEPAALLVEVREGHMQALRILLKTGADPKETRRFRKCLRFLIKMLDKAR